MHGWTQVSPGVFNKDFGGAEKIYHRISQSFAPLGKEHWRLYCICSLHLDPLVYQPESTVRSLQEAWKYLRFEFPGLSVIPRGSSKSYTLATVATVEKWCRETFFVETGKQPDQVLATIKQPRSLPSFHYFPSSDEVLFISSHWRIDAIGTCMLLDRFFAIVAERPWETQPDIPWATEVDRLSPSMEDAAGSAITSIPEIEDLAKRTVAKHQDAHKTAGLAYDGDKATLPGQSSRQTLVFSREETQKLVSRCKEKGITVTAAIHSALAETIFHMGPDGHQDLDHTAVMSVNVRNYLPAPYNSPAHACQTYVTGITPRARRESGFLDRALALKGEYKSWYSDLYLQSLRVIYKYHEEILFPSSRADDVSPPSGVFVSSLGVVEPHLNGNYGSLAVKAFRFGVSMMTRQMIVYVWTFRGQLTLSTNYNDAYYCGEIVEDVLRRVRSCLAEELGA